MYSVKLKHIRDNVPIGTSLSGILKQEVEEYPIATPCSMRFTKLSKESKPCRRGPVVKSPFGDKVPAGKKKSAENFITFDQLCALPLEEAQKTLDSCSDTYEVVFPWTAFNSSWTMLNNISGFKTYLARYGSFLLLKEKPLIHDDNIIRIETNDFKNLMEGDPRHFPLRIQEALRKYRYVNHTIWDVNKSNLAKVFDYLMKVIRVFSEYYPVRVSKIDHGFPKEVSDFKLRCLTDIISLSFYRLRDVIPIFDHKKARNGVAIELFVTNSSLGGTNIFKGGMSINSLFLFNDSKENVLVLDGSPIEMVMRSINKPNKLRGPIDVVSSYGALLSHSAPNDSKSMPEIKAKSTGRIS